MPPYKYSDPGTPVIKAYTLTRNGIAGSASHIGHAAHSSGVQLGIEPTQRYNWPRRPAGGNKPNLRVFSFSDAFRLPINVCD